jgi:hypothetical protein
MNYVLIHLEKIGFPTLISLITNLRAFDGILCYPLGTLPNLPIHLGGKTVLINVVGMDGPMDYTIILNHDFIYSMSDKS